MARSGRRPSDTLTTGINREKRRERGRRTKKRLGVLRCPHTHIDILLCRPEERAVYTYVDRYIYIHAYTHAASRRRQRNAGAAIYSKENRGARKATTPRSEHVESACETKRRRESGGRAEQKKVHTAMLHKVQAVELRCLAEDNTEPPPDDLVSRRRWSRSKTRAKESRAVSCACVHVCVCIFGIKKGECLSIPTDSSRKRKGEEEEVFVCVA